MRRFLIVAFAAAALLVPGAQAVAGAGSASSETDMLPGETSSAFWPHETGVAVGTSETYVDVREDGSYYDPSIGRRVSRAG